MENTTHYIYGMRAVTEAVRSGRKFEKVLFKQGMEGAQYRELLDALMQNDIPFQFVPFQKLNSLVKGAHQGVVAYISQIDYVPYEEMIELAMSRKEAPLFLLLDGVSDVRNFGAIARTAECAGVDGIILPAKGGAAINADAVKTSAGALLRVPTAKVTNLKLPLYYLLESGFQVVAATEKAETSLYDVKFRKPTAIVMGSEQKGISPAVLDLCTAEARIPMMGEIGSLNVSVAAAIVLYEAVRQRQ
ncbi:MAG: 23S rRNA (guanosine(2251)-2'-O)-methyltransferase RlmB [Bacteroidales bacterium]|jgi:23S rRNA (guanosine2251-2'-O)-methyltransferase|nr:23S rRNA (guanosine(2251)-2'-O)-methyltransferase RlmB [Bacteroidales bacterium]MBR3526205.1 23S rRNA (guanosine(2251)-2'-O)-methyltransferase RlmB [Bacteroidales bacterium]MCR5827292.1 23S rRNA (guanosine(2251)-2'-O)-methyltransferase RlmB [Bacteroidales bacterium]